MNKIFILFVVSLFAIVNVGAQQLYLKKTDGTYQPVSGNSLFFSQNGDKDEWSLSTVEGGVYRSANDISKLGKVAVLDGEELELATYKAPTYPDYYILIGSWSQRSKWNLSNLHDPSVVKAADGYYYMYQTDAGYGNPHNEDVVGGKYGHFYCRRSKNLVDWEFMGATMRGLPAWVKPKFNEIRKEMGLEERPDSYFSDELQFGYWAPCVRKVNDNLYRMYYSIVCPGNINGDYTWGERAFIGLMETTDPSDLTKWEDKGYVITNASDKGIDFSTEPYLNVGVNKDSRIWQKCYYKYNAIDPTIIITPEGEHWMIYGSWHSGFAAVELDPATGKTKDALPKPFGTAEEIAPYGKLIFTRTLGDRWQGAEAPEVVYRNGYYYLFVAYDALDVPYNTRVLRSKNIDGPYETMNGAVTDAALGVDNEATVLTHPYKFGNDHGWVGISHCAVFDDGNDNWYYCSQQRFPNNYDGNQWSNAVMLGGVRSIKWLSNGWPVVMPERYGAVPEFEISEEEIVGTWEHVDLGWVYGVQKQSATMEFGEDHKIVSGIWKGGTWSFDPSTNTLTANGVELKVQREVDWESSSRKPTIVYSGLNGNKSYWGKKQ